MVFVQKALDKMFSERLFFSKALIKNKNTWKFENSFLLFSAPLTTVELLDWIE